MAKFELDEELVRRLSQLLAETELNEIEYEAGGQRIRVARQGRQAGGGDPAAPAASAQGAEAGEPTTAPPSSEHTAEPVPPGAVTSPMVGTVYVAPEPGAPPFAGVGEEVEEGATLLIIEAMKVMNPLPAPRPGKVSRVFVTDGQPVEFGEPLLVIE